MKSVTKLDHTWNFYLHLHDNSDWTMDSYIKMLEFDNVEYAILLNDEVNYDLIKKSMIFIMKNQVKPMWEDEHNRNGGCFSFKISNKDVAKVWKEVYFGLVGNSLTNNHCDYEKINGITLSPKKKFCILKIWMKDCTLDDPSIFVKINDLKCDGCIFKRHCPEHR
uniref:Uncharacterized protein n=1 Tax=viral metagenome TaxID=1070528 RepID=A0A6C0L164_9ZZZZ|tara:strand:- start:1947 stop:2441 length:495 start_codon:yes stop_codon:yes gene_type:complete